MIESILKNLAYNYYPKGISSHDQPKYINSDEYIKLSETLHNVVNDKTYKELYEKLMFKFIESNFKDINDVSLLHWEDRCITLKIEYLEGDELSQIIVNISLLIPYYLVYVLDNTIKLDPYKWVTFPKRNKLKEITLYKKEITVLKEIIEDTIGFSLFPDNILSGLIPDLSFKDIPLGNFTFFNAFFLDDNIK